MAYSNKVISNTQTGQTIRFVQTAKDTNGQFLEMESNFSPNSKEPPSHYHPHQEEDFTVLSGELTVRINGETKILKQGDHLHVPANTIHGMWNQSAKTTVVSWRTRPAMNTEYFFETVMGLSNDGKTNKDGIPNILQSALLLNKYTSEYRPAKPPYIVQKIVFGLLTPFAYLFGYKTMYKKYID